MKELRCTEMFSFQERLKSFKKWKFTQASNCSAPRMAQSGFYKAFPHREDDDTVICYYCQKELDGWEETDIPYQEHSSHSQKCPFLQMFPEPPKRITVDEVIELELARALLIMEKKLIKPLCLPTSTFLKGD